MPFSLYNALKIKKKDRVKPHTIKVQLFIGGFTQRKSLTINT